LAKGTQTTLNITYNLGNGKTIILGTLTIDVDAQGNISVISNLIDPYGVVGDEATGSLITGAKITLYYADTPRNFAAGITPNTIVDLPSVAGFNPNDNANPQLSDANGTYGFLVFPNTDYYVIVSKDGYLPYTSPAISVEQQLVNWNISLHPVGTDRLAGTDRVGTSIAIAKATYPNEVNNVVLATADNYPDALTGSVLAYKLKAPLLLVGSAEVDQAKLMAYLKNSLAPNGTVYILGGTGAVSQAVQDNLKNNGFDNLQRIGGADRYATSLAVAKYFNLGGNLVTVATGYNFPDALSGSVYAAQHQAPILLTDTTLSSAELTWLEARKPAGITVFGGDGAVSQAVEEQLNQVVTAP
jgi:putative cell wall-binding protein